MSSRDTPSLRGRRVLVTGAGGQLGQYLVAAIQDSGGTAVGAARSPGYGVNVVADLADRVAALNAIDETEPELIIHAAACTDVDGIEREPERGKIGNAIITRNVVDAARACGAYLLAVSTDMVFPGDGGAPYDEAAPTWPISAYGQTKLAAEHAVLGDNPAFAVARTAWLYGGAGKHFPRTVLTVLRDRGAIEVVDDEWGSPTFAGDLAAALVALAAKHGGGIFHLVNRGRANRFALARETALLAGYDPDRVHPISTIDFLQRFPLPAKRPPDSTLENVRAAALGVALRNWREALATYVPVLASEIGVSHIRNRE